MNTIFVSVQTGMVVRDLLRCGPLDRILSHPDAHVVLLTPGVRDPAFVTEFSHPRLQLEPHQPYGPTPMVWRLMNRRWRHSPSASVADAIHRLEERFIPIPPAYDELFREHGPSLVVVGDPLRPADANLIAAARRHGVPSLGSVRRWVTMRGKKSWCWLRAPLLLTAIRPIWSTWCSMRSDRARFASQSRSCCGCIRTIAWVAT